MNRGFGGLPLHSLLRRLLHQRNNFRALLIPPSVFISNHTIPVPQILTRNFSSKITDEELSRQQNPFFLSLKCYTRDDPDTPYYVIQSPHLLQKEANDGKSGYSLPETMHLSCNIIQIKCQTCAFYLVGVHSNGDQKTIQDAEDIINHLKPEVIFLELCASRSAALQKLQDDNKNQAQNRVFPVAFEIAMQNGAKVVLGDRPFHITVRKILEGMLAMRPWEFTKLSFYLLFRFIEYGKNNKTFDINDFVLKKLEDLKTFSTLKQPTIHERDLSTNISLFFWYMSSVLTKIADEHSLVVAFIGSDHVSGIKKHLQQTFAINLSEEIPASK